MAEQRQPFRFRLPWLSTPAAPAPRPAAESQPPRPPVQTQTSTQPTTTTVPYQRPPFRPAGIAPAPQVTSQAQAPQRTEPQQPSQSRATTQPQVTSQPTSTPSRSTTQTQAAVPPPSRATTQPQVTSQPASAPSRSTTQSQAAVPPPSRATTQPQATSQPASTPSRSTTQAQAAVPPPPGATTQPQVTSQPASSPSRSTTQPQAAVPPPSRATNGSRVTSQPASPSRTTNQTRNVASLPSSPSRAAPQSRAYSVPPSPSRTSQTQPASRTDPQPEAPPRLSSQPAGRTTSQPSSPALTTTQVQPTGTTNSQPKIQESSQPTPTSTQSPSSVSELEPKPVVVSQPPSQEPQPKAQVPSETTSKPQNNTPVETSSQPDGVATQPTKVSPASIEATETLAPTKKLDSKPLPEKESEESQVGKKVVQEKIEEKKSGPAYEEPAKRTIAELVSSATAGLETQAKDLQSFVFQAKHKQHEKREETFERKETVVTTSSNAEQIKTSSSVHPKGRHTSIRSTTQRPSAISSGGQVPPFHEEVTKDISRFVQKLAGGHQMDENPVSIITLTGENRGATMHLSSELAKKEEAVHIHRGYKLNPDESINDTTVIEGSSKDKVSKENFPSCLHVNSNVQSINNSIVSDTSFTARNPGVHCALSLDQGDSIKSKGKPALLETHKAEFSVTPAEKHTYEPTVKRRCLRGLFMESSDSDPDNPEKPRRHGCRYSCGDQKNKDKDIGVQ